MGEGHVSYPRRSDPDRDGGLNVLSRGGIGFGLYVAGSSSINGKKERPRLIYVTERERFWQEGWN